jgi:hypothetical protein
MTTEFDSLNASADAISQKSDSHAEALIGQVFEKPRPNPYYAKNAFCDPFVQLLMVADKPPGAQHLAFTLRDVLIKPDGKLAIENVHQALRDLHPGEFPQHVNLSGLKASLREALNPQFMNGKPIEVSLGLSPDDGEFVMKLSRIVDGSRVSVTVRGDGYHNKNEPRATKTDLRSGTTGAISVAHGFGLIGKPQQ